MDLYASLHIAVNQEDFMSPQLQEITFSIGTPIDSSTTSCFSVNTSRDGVVEGDEEFVVSIVGINDNLAENIIITVPNTVNVLIQDSTGWL